MGRKLALTTEQVAEIRQSDKSFSDLAKQYGVSSSCVAAAYHGDTWRELPNAQPPRGLKTKLTAAEVREIRKRRVGPTELAKRYEVCRTQIYNVLNRTNWKKPK